MPECIALSKRDGHDITHIYFRDPEKPVNNFDSRPDTFIHIRHVQRLLNRVIGVLLRRSESHDSSKVEEPEVSVFDEFTPKLRDSTYSSDEYNEFLKNMKEQGLNHHYAFNPHHPEFYEDGIEGMSLIDLIEMICDWKAATLRHDDGDLMHSIEINQDRFGYSDQLKQILINTAHDLHLHDDNTIGHQAARRAQKWKDKFGRAMIPSTGEEE